MADWRYDRGFGRLAVGQRATIDILDHPRYEIAVPTTKGALAMKQFGMFLALAVVLSGSLVPIRVHAGDEVQQARIEMGRIWYQKYCTPCHGPGGAPGSAVSATKQPVDLRDYVQRNGGKFPSSQWIGAVFGPRPGATHTEVWEKIRSAQTDNVETAAIARGVVANIADYVISIQTK